MKKIIAALALTAFAQCAAAEEIDLNISSDAVRGGLSGPLSRLFSGVSGQYDAGLIYKEGEDNSADPKDAKLTLGHFGVLATGDMGAKVAQAAAGLGVRAVFADREGTTGAALALGGQFEVRLPGFERVGLSGYGYIAPNILSFSDVKSYSEYALDVEFEVIRAAAVYAGYRRVNVKPEPNGPSNADDGAHIGLRLTF
ncbi:MAG: YfaZ family outer membrane protein [Stagnimonas sp.]|nr:YfaZ family outer membrane protein [Stagnimonas sp.]